MNIPPGPFVRPGPPRPIAHPTPGRPGGMGRTGHKEIREGAGGAVVGVGRGPGAPLQHVAILCSHSHRCFVIAVMSVQLGLRLKAQS